MMPTESAFVEHRPLLFSIAYRMLGNVADAEDIVQEAFLRWHAVDHSAVAAARSYLATIVTRLCLDHQRSAPVRRECGELPELPGPLPPGAEIDAARGAMNAESLSVAFLVLLGKLSPAERAAFLLRVVFEFDYADVASMLGRSQAACRQLVGRARRRIGDDAPRYRASRKETELAVRRFRECAEGGDLDGLLAVLSPEVTLHVDAGADGARFGRVRNLTAPLRGAESAARFLIASRRQAPATTVSLQEEINGAPSLLTWVDGELVGVLSFDVADGKIRSIYLQSDPRKLSALADLN